MMTTVVEVRTSWPRLGVLKFLTLMLLSQIIVQFKLVSSHCIAMMEQTHHIESHPKI